MALQINLAQTQFGVPAPQAYARVTNYFGTKDNCVLYRIELKSFNLSNGLEAPYGN